MKKNTWLVVALIALPTLVVIVIVALVVLRFTVANPYKVPSASMIPTLAPDSHVIVDKTDKATPRGRVIAFKYPEHPEQEFIKRVIGLPGETISANDTEILIDGKPIPRCRVGDWTYTDPNDAVGTHTGVLWLEALDRAKWLVFHDSGAFVAAEGPWTVAPGEVFVLGDNRENSHDSRMWWAGKGGGVAPALLVGSVSGTDAPVLPRGAESLKSAFDACVTTLAK